MLRMRLTLLCTIIILISTSSSSGKENSRKILPRVIITTDINNVGGDPDDKQSLAHLLMYANELEIEAIVPDYWKGKGIVACNEAIDAYEMDYNNPDYNFQKLKYPHPDSIRNRIAKNDADAISRIISAAKKDDARPVYILVWGNMKTVKKALFQAPEIAPNIRILSIATNLMAQNADSKQNANVDEYCKDSNWNGKGRNEIFNDHRFNNLWWIENDWAYNGMFEGQTPKDFLIKIKQFGQLGFHIWQVVQSRSWAHYFRAGDTPTVLYLLEDIDHNLPSNSTWAGKFIKPFPLLRPNYWIDDAGTEEWDYENPCKTWDLAGDVYLNRVNGFLQYREDMYKAFRIKMNQLYR